MARRIKAQRDTDSFSSAARRRGGRLRFWVFRLLAVVLGPLLFLGTLELGLRIVGYGRATSFFVESNEPGEYFSNRRFTWTYFGREMSREPIPMVVSREKPKNVYRIFVFGGSAAHGVPNMAFSFSRILEAMLNESLPKTRFEVINTGTTAINSHVVRQLVRDCGDFQGDLYIVYMGNNELIGPYAPGTIFKDFNPRLTLIRAGIFMQSTRLGQLLSNLATSVGLKEPKGWKRVSALRMLMENPVSADDSRLAIVYENFRANLTDICEEALSRDAKVLLATVVTNLKDQVPFYSKHRPDLSDTEKERWEGHYEKGIALQSDRDFKAAVEEFAAAERIDSEFAELHYRLGHCWLSVEQADAAREAFVRARDLDNLRVRADTEINNTIREIAASYRGKGVYLVDAEKTLSKEIPGAELLYEYVHFNFVGNYTMAARLFESIVSLLPEKIRNTVPGNVEVPSLDRCVELTRFNPYHQLRSVEYISKLLTGLPSSELHCARHQAEAKRLQTLMSPEMLTDIVNDYRMAVKEKPGDLLFRLNLVEVQLALGDYDEAAQQCRQLLRAYPDWMAVRGALARAFYMQRRTTEAIAQLVTVLEEDPNNMQVRKILGMALLQNGEVDRAIEELGKVLRGWADDAEVHAELARAFLAKKQWSEARSSLENALQSDPNNAHYHFLLAVVLVELGGDGAVEEALGHYTDSLRSNPGYAKAYVGRGKLLLKRGELKEALRDLSKAVELSPRWPEARYRRAQLLFKLGDLEGSVADLKECLKLAPQSWPSRRRAERLLADLRKRGS